MNTIAAELRQTPETTEPHLHYIVDGQRLDELLHGCYPTENYLGLIPTLLSWLDRPAERQVVWARATLGAQRVRLPILMCPEDQDLSCITIVAEVIVEDEVVRWPRIGWDATRSPDPADCGTTVEWLPLVPAFTFDRTEYQRCIDTFAAALEEH